MAEENIFCEIDRILRSSGYCGEFVALRGCPGGFFYKNSNSEPVFVEQRRGEDAYIVKSRNLSIFNQLNTWLKSKDIVFLESEKGTYEVYSNHQITKTLERLAKDW